MGGCTAELERNDSFGDKRSLSLMVCLTIQRSYRYHECNDNMKTKSDKDTQIETAGSRVHLMWKISLHVHYGTELMHLQEMNANVLKQDCLPL